MRPQFLRLIGCILLCVAFPTLDLFFGFRSDYPPSRLFIWFVTVSCNSMALAALWAIRKKFRRVLWVVAIACLICFAFSFQRYLSLERNFVKTGIADGKQYVIVMGTELIDGIDEYMKRYKVKDSSDLVPDHFEATAVWTKKSISQVSTRLIVSWILLSLFSSAGTCAALLAFLVPAKNLIILDENERIALANMIASVFQNPQELQEFLRDKRQVELKSIVSLNRPMNVVANRVVADANANGWARDLIYEIVDQKPHGERIREFYSTVSVGAQSLELEAKIRQSLKYFDVVEFRENLEEIENHVCQISTPSRFGTGILLAPDIVLTNYHVMMDVIDNPGQAGSVVFKFDFKLLKKRVLHPGVDLRLAGEDWLVDYALIGGDNPQADELDYALVRLNKKIGDEPLVKGVPNGVLRGWTKISEQPEIPKPNSPIFVVQHPAKEDPAEPGAWQQPLKVAFDSQGFLGFNQNQTRIKYSTNTSGGSSGAPVFNSEWQLVGIHQGGERAPQPTYNQGIPVSAIVQLLKQRGKANVLH